MAFLIEFCLIVLTLVFLIMYLIKHKYSYWERKGLPYVTPSIPNGILKNVGKDISFVERLREIYESYKEKHDIIGAYLFWNPIVIVNDLELIKNIFIRDFNYFHDRQFYYNEKDDPISAHLFSLDGQKWKSLRSKLTSTFTSGKMKFMFPTVVQVGTEFQNCVANSISNENIIEIKELLARFTTDVIGTVAFGIECNSLKNPNSEFRMNGLKMFSHPRHGELTRLFLSSFPEIGRFLHIKMERDDVSKFFMSVVRETVEYREKNNIRRNDFMDILIQMKNENENGSVNNMTLEEIAAQSYLFFGAGFETSSTALGYCLYELALNQNIQDKARDEINHVLERHKGELTYDALYEMTYILKVLDETLRKYPPGAAIARVATQDYEIPNKSGLTIEKGTLVFTSILGIHHDPKFYPNPEEFDPERFNSELNKERHTAMYFPFGLGPRNCIGLRFGKMQAYIGLVMLLKKFKFSPSPKTEIPLQFEPDTFVLTSKGGLWLNVEKIK